MLADITIENLGVIPKASAELAPGLSVLTGETGAGKTMVVTGLRLLSGGRADPSRVRAGSKKAVVEGRFTAEGMSPEVQARCQEILAAAGGEVDENGDYLALRSLSVSEEGAGRSRAHLGGRAVPAATLAEFAAEVLTIHGQNDQLRLLSPERQLAALDRFDPRIAPVLKDYRELWAKWRELARDLKKRTESRRELAQEVDRLQFAIEEISAIDPTPGEDQELIASIRRMQDVDTLREHSIRALHAIDGVEDMEALRGAAELAGEAENLLSASADERLKALGEQLGEVTASLADVSAELASYLDDLPVDPAELENLLQRQQELKTLTRKYAPDADGVIVWKKKAEKRLASIDVSTEALDQLKTAVAEAEKKMKQVAKKLRALREEAATKLAAAVTKELHGLAMPKSRLEVQVNAVEPGAYGTEEVQLLLAPTPKSPGRPLASSASGGELSRVMLALEVILSESHGGATMVFDEVDAGVGGKAAVEIGRRLARLARSNQVIVVTHLPQVAAYADAHLHVAKEVTESEVSSAVELLSEERRIEELARMLAGMEDTETGRAHAAELLATAQAEIQKM